MDHRKVRFYFGETTGMKNQQQTIDIGVDSLAKSPTISQTCVVFEQPNVAKRDAA